MGLSEELAEGCKVSLAICGICAYYDRQGHCALAQHILAAVKAFLGKTKVGGKAHSTIMESEAYREGLEDASLQLIKALDE